MKAAVLNRINKPLEIENLIQEDPKYGEVKIKVNYAGICASDLHIMEGTASLPMPAVLGHEGSGTVVEVHDVTEEDLAKTRRQVHNVICIKLRALYLL